MELNNKQKIIVESEAPHILCLASAGTGKTRVLTERILHLIHKKEVAPEKIVAITFTNMASDEMKRRLFEYSNRVWIGTIHSYANYICVKNGLNTSKYIEEETFDKIIEKALTLPQSKFEKINHLLVDECQDISELEYRFLCKIPTENDFYVGDDRQNIYQFKGCTDEYLRQMRYNPDYQTYCLVDNYRNAPNIIETANRYLYNYDSLSPNCNPIKKQKGFVCNCDFQEALEDLIDSNNWRLWFIITRTNAEVEMVIETLQQQDIPYASFKKGDLSTEELENVLSQNKVKVLTAHSAKGLECKRAILVGMLTYNEEERKVAYVAATRPENVLYICPPIQKKGKRGRKSASKKSKTLLGNNSNMVVF